LDVHEDDKVYRVTVDMHGVPKDNIDVAIEGNQVSSQSEKDQT
jgi:HSP20 family molecular chaperone IbpA